jgi:hypothetical protein
MTNLKTHRIERRKHPRLALHSVVLVSRGPGHSAVEVTTKDISIGGFYYLSVVTPTLGETIDCLIVIASAPREPELRLRCRAQVLRVEACADPSGLHGIACRIEKYQVLVDPRDRWAPASESGTLLI